MVRLYMLPLTSSDNLTYPCVDVGEDVKVGVCKMITEEEREKMFDTFKETLARYNFDWKSLQAIMATTGAVISGSTALAILLGGEFVPQDLDIYVNTKGFTAILGFLMDHGYHMVIPYPHYKKKYSNSKRILTLKRDGEKIDLIGTEVHVLTAITEFHSTAVMNYIAFYGIVCLYPEWTMRRNSLVAKTNTPYKILSKYRGRGFKIEYAPAKLANYDVKHNCGKHICCPKMERDLRDGFSLFIPFQVDDRDTNIHKFEENEKMRLQWILKDVRECRTWVE